MASIPVPVDDVPLLVRVLAGNQVTGLSILSCLSAPDTRALRRLHVAVAGAVAGVPWADRTTRTLVADVVRWRATLPAAVSARLAEHVVAGLRRTGAGSDAAVAALAGITALDLRGSTCVTNDVLLRLPASLRTLNVRECGRLTPFASFLHLTALVSLDCTGTEVVMNTVEYLPQSLQELSVSTNMYPGTFPSMTRLRQLRVLRVRGCGLEAKELASLPPSLVELHAGSWTTLPMEASFAHLCALRTLHAPNSDICDVTLATLPPSLVFLDATRCQYLSSAAVLPPLPALRLLDVSGTCIGDALVASLPAGLTELRMVVCSRVTARATLDHVPSLRTLHSTGTALAPAVTASCRTRGCAVFDGGVGYRHWRNVTALAVLGDGRLASGDGDGVVQLRDVAGGGDAAAAVLRVGGWVSALAALPDGRRLAIGTKRWLEVWDVADTPPFSSRTIHCDAGVNALAVLADGRLAMGCKDGRVLVVDTHAGGIVVLEGRGASVEALAVLPAGALAGGAVDGTVRLWDVGTGVCVTKLLGGRNCGIASLVVLPDGRLACGGFDGAIALWDAPSRTRVDTMAACGTGCESVVALAMLPDGRLVSGSDGGVIQLWDTRPAATAVVAASSRPASAVPMVVLAHVPRSVWPLVPLPDGRLACTSGCNILLLEVPPPVVYE